eukprot:TRINITY_DN687_c0_g1_i1.p1 TRINITY_DN687_c0_g1~~TRINITY_DN687_c0_g1_i1.p1  ORF type:complete len:616 (+),score=67.69 TRINITY_DN687_c0_g1_i1:207-1850(+)
MNGRQLQEFLKTFIDDKRILEKFSKFDGPSLFGATLNKLTTIIGVDAVSVFEKIHSSQQVRLASPPRIGFTYSDSDFIKSEQEISFLQFTKETIYTRSEDLPEEEDEDEMVETLQGRLASLGFQMEDFGRDGDCLYRVFGYKYLSTSKETKETALKWLRSNATFMIGDRELWQFVGRTNQESDWDAYCKSFEPEGAYANHIILFALAQAFRTIVHLYYPQQGQDIEIQPVSYRKLISVGFIPETHYVFAEQLFKDSTTTLIQKPPKKIKTLTISKKQSDSFESQQLSFSIIKPLRVSESAPTKLWCCRSPKSRKRIVIKINRNPELALQEVKFLTMLSHCSFIPKLYDNFYNDSGQYVLITEYVSGGLFVAHLENEMNIFFFSLVEGIYRMHQLGIVHYDIKNSNVLFDKKEGIAKIIDFEYAECRQIGDNWNGEFKGTKEYTAPEVINGGLCNHGLDIWSLGAMLVLLLLGPFWKSHNDLIEITQMDYVQVLKWAKKQVQIRFNGEWKAHDYLTERRWKTITQMLNPNIQLRFTSSYLYQNFKELW